MNKRLAIVIGLGSFVIISLILIFTIPISLTLTELRTNPGNYYSLGLKVVAIASFESDDLAEYVDADRGNELKLDYFKGVEGGLFPVDRDSCFMNNTFSRIDSFTITGYVRKALTSDESVVYYLKCSNLLI